MNDPKNNSANYINYIDHSSSAIAATISQTTADPINLASLIKNSVTIVKVVNPDLKLIELSKDEEIEN